MAAVSERQENVQKIVKDFALQLQPHLNMANIDKIEDMLIHMEESDGGHEMKALIKYIRRKLTSKLSGYLDEEIEKHSQLSHIDAEQQDKLVDVIFEKVQKSKQFLDCKYNIENSFTDAVNELIKNFDHEMTLNQGKEHRGEFDRNSLTVSDDSSLSFSLTQTAFLFVGQEQLLLHAQGIQKNKSQNDRLENLRALSQMPVSDLLNAECWSLIRKGILECLVNDDDDKLWFAAFKCCTRGLSFNSPPSKDLYTLLIEFLQHTFSKRFQNWKIANGYDGQNIHLQRMTIVVKVLNDYQQQITNFWVRFSQDKFLEEIVDTTLGLLAFQPNLDYLGPFHLMAMIDMEACWLRAWTHASFSRLPLYRLLEKHKVIVQMAVAAVLAYGNNNFKIKDITLVNTESKGHQRSPSNISAGDVWKCRYNDKALQHISLLYSLHTLRYLLSFKQGCQYFPVRYRNDQISLKQLMVEMVTMIGHEYAVINKPSFQPYNPSFVATDVLKHICLLPSVRSITFSDEFISALLIPVRWNPSNHGQDSVAIEHYNNVLLLTAHVFSAMAFDETGKSYLLFGSSKSDRSSGNSKQPAVHTLVKFVVDNMESDMLWRRVLGAYIYLCRQLYASCQGLEVIKPYNLHQKLAEAKEKSAAETKFAEMERSASATTLVNDDESLGNIIQTRDRSGSRGNKIDEKEASLALSSASNVGNISGIFSSRARCGSSKPSLAAFWDETLKDNLLGFASTPGGILMLCETGFFSECITYMVQRYSSGAQMSKYEKYGYGSMVSQISATLPGCEALSKSTELISNFIYGLWCKIETVPYEEVSVHPQTWTTSVIDRLQHKPFIRLLNAINTYPAIWFQLNDAILPNLDSYSYENVPRSFLELIDRIVFVNSEAKARSLYNYEQSTSVGLRILASICANLNSFVLLENRFSIVDFLLNNQSENVMESGDFMIDEQCVIRNRILTWVGAIGGPGEKVLPPCSEPDQFFIEKNIKLFDKLPIPNEYFILPGPPTSRARMDKKLVELIKTHRNGTKDDKVGKNIKSLLFDWLEKKPDLLEESSLGELQEVLLCLSKSRNEHFQIPLKSIENYGENSTCWKYDNEWVAEMIVDYGIRLSLLKSDPSDKKQMTKDLLNLLKRSEAFYQPGKTKTSSLRSHHSEMFDWFVAVIYLLFNGDSERALEFLQNLSGLTISLFLWPKRAVNFAGFSDTFLNSGISILFTHVFHFVQWILQEQLPIVHSALKLSGFSCSQLCDQWLCQSFLNYLNLPEIFEFIALSLAAGPDYVIYANVALFNHMKVSIAQSYHEQTLQMCIKEKPISGGFTFSDHFAFMESLERQYRQTVLKNLDTFFS